METSNKEKVYEVLKKEGDWMSIVQVAKAAGLTRTTASAYLHVMAAEGRIEEKKFAQAWVFRVKAAGGAQET
ncbi:MAG: hypothetical protein Q8O76_14405 [Chloroflexota bacterium]|nr:hypothetical protein [Chloroflexota bacterium]